MDSEAAKRKLFNEITNVLSTATLDSCREVVEFFNQRLGQGASAVSKGKEAIKTTLHQDNLLTEKAHGPRFTELLQMDASTLATEVEYLESALVFSKYILKIRESKGDSDEILSEYFSLLLSKFVIQSRDHVF